MYETSSLPRRVFMATRTIPAAGMLRRALGTPVVLLGLALPDDRAHAPNERLHLPTLWQGIDTLIWFLLEVAASAPRPPRCDEPPVKARGRGVAAPRRRYGGVAHGRPRLPTVARLSRR